MSKNNKRIELLEEKESWQDYLDPQSFSFFPEKDAWRNRLCHTLLLWGQREDSYDLLQFCFRYKIKRATLYKWRTQYDDIREAVEEVKLMLGCRRSIGALKRELDKDVVFKSLHRYDEEWKEVDKYWADLKKDEAAVNGVQFVVIPEIPSTGLVKPLSTKETKVDPSEISDHNTKAVLVTKK